MSKDQHFVPEHSLEQFHCPHCGVFSKQRWSHIQAMGDIHTRRNNYNQIIHESNIFNKKEITGKLPESWTISICEHCEKMAIWLDDKMIYPKIIIVESSNQDLSPDIQSDYLEAASVLSDSPRSAAAILRLALQKLCKQLGEKGHDINTDIASLVKKGLNPAIQKSLDALRITGNNAVHPGELDLKEDTARVMQLFRLINFIAEKMITEPKEIDSFYDTLPEGAKKAVETRDQKNP